MLVQADVKGLETVCAAYLSQCPVLMAELNEGIDIHSMNETTLGLPNRDIAKIFLFRILYGGGAYSFSVDSDFELVGFNEKQWQDVIENFYKKYVGLQQWHNKILQDVVATGRLVVPCTGRVYKFEASHGKFPDTQIKNYPVQGLGADIVALARVSLFNRMKKLRQRVDGRWNRVLLVNTVHDSLIFDCPNYMVHDVAILCQEVFRDVPVNFEKIFKTPFNLEVKVEIEVGETWGNMQKSLDTL